ncbi:radial spoke head 10 homolog B2 [Lates japonicus]|uniref:Radial spoke head 10 homolog B2 n=1 Tax=Lates japonicus TaxID=270547 RepID=A0AAD3R507_LATJO|nr:radial spoke head 10 homolog B2 [Lates japonicus]
MPMGQGTYTWPDGSSYMGEVCNGIRHGTGTYICAENGVTYKGQWDQGKRHGKGTVYYNQEKTSWYKGDWVKNNREGLGVRCYPSGDIYSGEWKNNLRHGEGTMKWLKLSQQYVGMWQDGVQVEFVVLRKSTELRSIYTFYSRLGHAHSLDNTFLLSRLQLWRLLKDCNIHHHDITLTQIDHYIKEDTTTEIHSPFTPMLLRRLLSCLVIVAHHIYNKDMVSEKHLLAACLSKLMTDDILPNAKNVKGFLFGQPHFSVVAMKYMKRCWDVYQVYCRVHSAPRDDQTMTCRHLLWMFKDLHLLDNNLTTVRLLKIITAESRDPNNLSLCLDLEITFLEFFEVLLGCAEVKCQRVSESLEKHQSLSGSNTGISRDLPEVQASEKILQTTSNPSQSQGKSCDTAQDALESQDVKTEVSDRPQSAEHTEEHGGEGKGLQTRGMEAKDQTIHQFFNHFFFPAFDHHQQVTENMKEDKLCQEAQRRIALAKAQQRAREKEHQQANE